MDKRIFQQGSRGGKRAGGQGAGGRGRGGDGVAQLLKLVLILIKTGLGLNEVSEIGRLCEF